jgi:ATP-dependent Clp protease ATP-binding subunit ClpC
MTSNLGVKKLQDFGAGVGFKSATSSFMEEEQKRDILKKELQKFFAPEFLNRIDEIVVFNQLKKDDVKEIVKLELDKLFVRLQGLKYNITYDSSITEMISDVGFDELYGARPIKRAIQDKIEDFISEEVLNGNVVEGGEYILKYESETVKLEQITKKETTKKGKKKKGVE